MRFGVGWMGEGGGNSCHPCPILSAWLLIDGGVLLGGITLVSSEFPNMSGMSGAAAKAARLCQGSRVKLVYLPASGETSPSDPRACAVPALIGAKAPSGRKRPAV